MKQSVIKRGTSLFLAFLMCLTTFLGIGTTTAFAAGTKGEALLISYPREGDANYSATTWGREDMTLMNGWSLSKTKYCTLYTMNSYNGNICYCIEPGTLLNNGDVFDQKDETFFDNYPSEYNHTITPYEIQHFLGRILHYGYTGKVSTEWRSQNTEDANKLAQAIATQILVWETVVGERDSNFNHVSPGSCSAVYDMIRSDHPLRDLIGSYYSSMVSSVQKHTTLPSFFARSAGKAQNIELEWNGSEYTAVLTDTNGVLSNYTYSASNSNVKLTVNGNQLVITSSTAPTGTVSITAAKKSSYRRGILIWSDGNYAPGVGDQDTITYGQEIDDPVKGFLNIKVSYGSANIVKTSEDGKVDGVSFHVQGNGIDQILQTKNGGQIQVDNLMPGVYTVTELTEEKYEPQETRRVTVVSGQTATVTFSNILKRGDLTVTKTSEDGLGEGAKFHLYGTSLSGLAVDEYAVVGSDGKAYFKDVLIGMGYTLEEVDTAIRYVIPEKQTAAVEWNKVTNKSFDNILKKWQLTTTKSDKETGTAQGDASLAGAVYGIYKGDQLVDTYTTDANGQFTTKSYICGDDWSLREISASEGYLVTSGSEHIGAEAKLYTVEFNSTALDVLETVQKGKIALIKHCDDGETQIETPEAGAEFEVFLKSSESFEAAKESERDYLICDENGFAETKDLPYGIYTVKQTKGWDGKELMDVFDVFVSRDGEVYRYLINNAPFKSYIKVIKTDAETGKTIPYAGAAFQIYNPAGELVTMKFTYPEVTEIDTFYTTADGTLITPEVLDFGYGYSLVEVSAPFGYTIDRTPVYFDVTEDNSSEESAVTIIKVERPNMPQKGKIIIGKTGEVFSSVTAVGGGTMDEDGNDIAFPNIYQPVYSVQGLAGAVYEITAAEDVYTLDGTLRYSKGEVVAEITTDENGTATTDPLYLGKFEVREIKAPYGMTISDEVHPVELTYAGQEVEITETETAFYNERQKAEISLSKILEKNETFGIGRNSEILSVQFGLFAAEDLTAADGSSIPADGLLEIINCDENGNAVFKTDIPVGAKLYVKEIAVDNHYLLSDEKYPVEFVYAGQETARVEIKINDGNAIENKLIYGNIKGLKLDRETEETIAGALFGLFKADETEFMAEKAILTAESGEDGIFTFENVPYGNWLIKELAPAEGFLPNEEIYPVTVSEHEQLIEISIINDRIPEIGTQATVDGEKEIFATEVFTLTDTVSYKHLIPGKGYVLKGVLMDKSTGKPLVIDGQEIHAETVFIPDAPTGEAIVEFTFDSKYIKADTDIVVFESLYRDGKELTVHADIEDEGQTVRVKIPEIGTQATAEGKKEITAKGSITIDDIVSYKNLTPGKEYTVKGILMNKKTGEPFTADGKEITAEVTFTPEQPDGEVKVSFTFDAAGITTETEVVVFERLLRDGVEIAAHTDIEDDGQTVKLTPPAPDVPQTGDESNLGFWIGLGAVALGGLAASGIIYFRRKKDDDDE